MSILGASNEVFYHGGKKANTFNLRYQLCFKEAYDLDAMKTAAYKAIRLYPELGVKPVIQDGCYGVKEHDDQVVFFSDNNEVRHFGTDDTNGYLFFFTYKEKEINLYAFHGCTDFYGLKVFLREMLRFYLVELGIYAPDPEIDSVVRLTADAIPSADDMDAYDPYRMHGRIRTEKFQIPIKGEIFNMPDTHADENVYLNCEYILRISTGEFLSKTKELGVSFSPLLMTILTDTMDRAYEVGDQNIVGMLPVDMRRFFDSKTIVNFSDAAKVVESPEDRKKTVTERCIAAKDMINSQLTKENFEAVIARKTAGLDGGEKLATNEALKSGSAKLPFTMGVTYPGRISFGTQIDELLSGAVTHIYTRVQSAIISTFGDDMTFCISHPNEDDTIAVSLKRVLEEYGFETELENVGDVVKHSFDDEGLMRL